MSEQRKRFQCRHVFTNGHRCGSPCLRNEEFCYHHHATRKPVTSLAGRNAPFELPLPEDRFAIQLSIGEVLRRIAANRIDRRRAGLLLYGLQIASINLPRHRQPSPDPEPNPVEDIVTHPTLGTLAPSTEWVEAPKEKGSIRNLLDKWRESEAA